MNMAKLRRKNAVLESRLAMAGDVWRGITAENRSLVEQAAAAEVEAIQTRRKDLARIAAIHRTVQRASTGSRRGIRNYCEECNVPFPCRTVETIGRMGDELDALYRAAKAA